MTRRTPAANFSEASVRNVLAASCASVGLNPSGAQLLRLGENAIYSLRDAPVIVRIARTLDALEDVRKEVRVARWLAQERLPAGRLWDETSEPLVVHDHPVTFWQLIRTAPQPAEEADLARLLRQLHTLDPPKWLQLPDFDPFTRVADRLDQAPPATPKSEVAFLRELFHNLRSQYSQLTFEFPPSPLHGDAYVANVMRDESGTALLIDFEAFSFGPREWDLAITGARKDGFGWLSAEEYREFVEVYGYDILGWPGFPVLRAIRELTMTTWLMQLVDDPMANAEFKRRVSEIRSGSFPREWQPF